MKFTFATLFLLLFCTFAKGQSLGMKWYSEREYDGVTIQNSYPRGGPYPGPTDKHHNYSYLVFYSRIVNETEHPIELSVCFSADSISIPNSPNTFVKVFLPSDTMTLDKRDKFSYGITQLASFDEPTSFDRTIGPHEDCLFYSVALFYQANPGAFNEDRGGNRAEFILRGKELFYNLLPQIDALPCGQIAVGK
ncbi:hypothetical protein [Lewinella sp. W8]|uniref:hypothetical protein n=1 Tax=Lewinella sp. W8 TaxID=2528208 RepID=UPI0010689D2B|nr:hypothetical protein [Lewinella sp. W8]MTB50088.1 hypothetical protein [Lewinella sp. W8]